MPQTVHLWAIGYGDAGRAEAVRAIITQVARAEHCLILHDTAVLVRHPDGSFTLDGEPFATVRGKASGGGQLNIFDLLALSVPCLTPGAVEAMLDGAGLNAVADHVIERSFIRDVARLMTPGTSVLFVLDEVGNESAILAAIRGVGGTVLRTNVDVSRAELIGSTLNAHPTGSSDATRSANAESD